VRSLNADAEPLGGRVELRYVARAGLLPELSRQTYDSLYKALREAVLNAADAAATRVDLDFSGIGSSGELVVSDDGVGMNSCEFCDQFMSLGGSAKFGRGDRFGRIGIGSLALLQYSTLAIVETKQQGSRTLVRAKIEHPWALDGGERRARLGDLPAGYAEETAYDGPREDHFTRLRLQGLGSEVKEVEQDPASFYRLLESLRRVLPLPWTDSPLLAELEQEAPALAATMREHIAQWSIPVYVHSSWQRDIELSRRTYGDEPGGAERWNGRLYPILKTVRVVGPATASREVTLGGYLLSQRRAFAAWSGIAARVQNVTVEERTFFDVVSDPGFRKYISGEVFVMGDVDRERLINIDRASFNRESADYQAIQRFMSNQVLHFKSARVQRPQRQKVDVRRTLERHRTSIAAISEVIRLADTMVVNSKGLPSSCNGRIRPRKRVTIHDVLKEMGVYVRDHAEAVPGGTGFEIEIRSEDGAVEVHLPETLLRPSVKVGRATYQITFADGSATEPPVLIRNRPREIVFNRAHPAHASPRGHERWHISLALELSYLLAEEGNSAELFDNMLAFVAAM
jgi:hypothetical protein